MARGSCAVLATILLPAAVPRRAIMYSDFGAGASFLAGEQAAPVPSSESRVKRGDRVVGIDTELVEKLGRNDLCPCGSGRRLPPLLRRSRPFRRRTGGLLRPRLTPRTRATRFARRGLPPRRADALTC